MQVTQELMKEHQLILKYIDLMQRYINFSQSNPEETLLQEKAQNFIDFIQKFADTYHHAKEEDILFKFLQAPGVLSHCNPLPVMLSEHEQGRMYVQNMKEALASANKDNFCKAASAYGELLQQHIMKEDNVLYPMAEEGIADDDKIALDKEYQQIEENLGKQNIWNEFETQYSNMEKSLESKMDVSAS